MQLEQTQAAARLTALENWRQQADIAEVKRDGQLSNMKEKMDQVKADVTDIKGTLTWLNRLIIGGIIMGVIAFALTGGFKPL